MGVRKLMVMCPGERRGGRRERKMEKKEKGMDVLPGGLHPKSFKGRHFRRDLREMP